MKSVFSGYYSLSENELADLWKQCTFIVDTNILLNLYRYRKTTSDELLSVLKRISNRLWIPFQVALEYQENRLSVINEQVEIFHKVKDVLKKGQDNLESKLEELQLSQRHSLINEDEFLKRIKAIFEDFRQELDLLEKEQPNIKEHDKLRDEIDAIFDGRIGTPPNTQECLNAIYKDGEIRYNQKYPPGYMDVDKDKELIKNKEKISYLYNGLLFERKYGDLILWYQIIEEANKNENLKKIIFVTGDVKEDWWYKVDRFGSRAKAIIAPRPELVQEVMSKSGVLGFHMYQTDNFLVDANKYLGTQVSQETVEQIRDINTVSTQISTRVENNIAWFYRMIEPIIYEWLQTIYPPDKIIHNNRFPDYIILGENGHKTGYEVKFARQGFSYLDVLRKVSFRGQSEISKGQLNALKILVVTDTEEAVKSLEKTINKLDYPSEISVELGLVTFSQDEKPKFRKII